jgi:hypothetical protein
VRLRGFESGYAVKHIARLKRRATSLAMRLNPVGHSPIYRIDKPYTLKERNPDLLREAH